MQQLLQSTTAYKMFSHDAQSGRLSHAYMLCFSDSANLREALKFFALALFGARPGERTAALIEDESFADVKVFPAKDKKPSVSDADEIIADSALKPVEGDKKLYVFTSFESASPVVQNKLLKVLEEPPAGVYFLLGATSLSPVLSTIASRVKLLTIEPFSEDEVFAALCRRGGDEKLNRLAARSCAGCFGRAEAMVSGGWFKDIFAAANEICSADTLAKAGAVSLKYGDVKEKAELLEQIQLGYFAQLKKCISPQDMAGATFTRPALIYGIRAVNRAFADLNFNANFSSLLFDLAAGVITENSKWKKLLV